MMPLWRLTLNHKHGMPQTMYNGGDVIEDKL